MKRLEINTGLTARYSLLVLPVSYLAAALVARCESDSQDGPERLKDALVEQLRLSDVAPPNH